MNKEDLEAGEWYLCHSNHFPERTMVMHYHSNRFSNVIEDGELNVGVTFEYEILTVIHKMYKPLTLEGLNQSLILKDTEIAHLKSQLQKANDIIDRAIGNDESNKQRVER